MWYLSAAVFCSVGWFERNLMVVSVVVCFLYMSISRCGVYLCMVRLRKVMLWLFSCVGFELYVGMYLVHMCVCGVVLGVFCWCCI
jgi:hypothetical protein